MANGGGEGVRPFPDFDLPDHILAVIPTDPYDQLDLARKISSMAIASRVTMLETEAERLRHKLHEKDRFVEELQDKVVHLEAAFQDAEFRLKITREENVKLLNERDSLAMTAKKLTRDLAKLETFKKQLMQSLTDENSPPETVGVGTYVSVPKSNCMNDESNGYAKHHSYSSSTDNASPKEEVSKHDGQKISITPFITPSGTPTSVSTNVSPRRYSAASSPRKTSGTTSPITNYDGRGSFSSWYPSSQQSSAANSPPRARPFPGRSPRIDGKEFFRQARSRLSLEQFSAFLSNIKEFNAQRQSREVTLRKAEEIFGTENKDFPTKSIHKQDWKNGNGD